MKPDLGDLATLLAGIRHDPTDEAPRLVLADWFDENGDADRADFLRLGAERRYMERWLNWLIPESLRCWSCGSRSPRHEAYDYNPIWLDGKVRCLDCGVNVRFFNA